MAYRFARHRAGVKGRRVASRRLAVPAARGSVCAPMDPALSANLPKLALPLGGCGLVLLVTRWRGISWTSDSGLALRWPGAKVAATWLAAWIAWMALGELAASAFGLEQPQSWPEYSPLVFAVRIAAIGLAGPLAEELIMRGLAYSRLRPTRLGVRGAVLVTAAVWAGLHV